MIVQTDMLVKKYGDYLAVEDVSFHVNEGEVLALIGRNGAGKTTIIDMLVGLLQPTSGSVSVFGLDPFRDRKHCVPRIGVMLQEAGFIELLSVRETLHAWRRFYKDSRNIGDLAALVGLTSQLDSRVVQLSGGERRKLDLALSLLGFPDLLILDEPTTGFDPEARKAILARISDMTRDGLSVVMTSHYLNEVEALADHVVIIDRGRTCASGSLHELVGRGEQKIVVQISGTDASALIQHLSGDEATANMSRNESSVTIQTLHPDSLIHALSSWLSSHGLSADRARVQPKSLEEVFLELTSSEKSGVER